MRRRLSLLAVSVAALTVLGLGLAIGASARQDTLETVKAVTARFASSPRPSRPAMACSTSAPSSPVSARWVSTTPTAISWATRRSTPGDRRCSSMSRSPTARPSSSRSSTSCSLRRTADRPRTDRVRDQHEVDARPRERRGAAGEPLRAAELLPAPLLARTSRTRSARSPTGTRPCPATARATAAADPPHPRAIDPGTASRFVPGSRPPLAGWLEAARLATRPPLAGWLEAARLADRPAAAGRRRIDARLGWMPVTTVLAMAASVVIALSSGMSTAPSRLGPTPQPRLRSSWPRRRGRRVPPAPPSATTRRRSWPIDYTLHPHPTVDSRTT